MLTDSLLMYDPVYYVDSSTLVWRQRHMCSKMSPYNLVLQNWTTESGPSEPCPSNLDFRIRFFRTKSYKHEIQNRVLQNSVLQTWTTVSGFLETSPSKLDFRIGSFRTKSFNLGLQNRVLQNPVLQTWTTVSGFQNPVLQNWITESGPSEPSPSNLDYRIR